MDRGRRASGSAGIPSSESRTELQHGCQRDGGPGQAGGEPAGPTARSTAASN